MPIYDEIQESTDGTGTGDLTLDGASENGRTFATKYADGVSFPYKVSDGAGEWETGQGHVTSGDLVRDTPMDGSASLPVNFSAGTKQVFVVHDANTVYETPKYIRASATHKTVINAAIVRTGLTVGQLVDRFMGCPFILNAAGEFDAFQVYVSTGATAGGEIMFGLYDIGTDGRANILLAESAYIACTATGVTTATFTGGAIKLSPGLYNVVAICKTAACTINGGNSVYMVDQSMGVDGSFRRGAYYFHGTITSPTVMPNPFGTVTGESVNYTANQPMHGLRRT